MSKKKKNQSRNHQPQQEVSAFQLRSVTPMTNNQKRAFSAYGNGSNLVLHGYAGTGKTYVSIYLALEEVLSGKSGYDKVVIIRSAVPSRDMGFLPGTATEKMLSYEEPYIDICDSLFGNKNGYSILKTRGIVKFTSTSYLRGSTLDNAVIIIDEVQNMASNEIYTVLTRIGKNARVIICGDFRQCDLKKHENDGAWIKTVQVLKSMKSVSFIEFESGDIVRSDFSREFIIKHTEINNPIVLA